MPNEKGNYPILSRATGFPVDWVRKSKWPADLLRNKRYIICLRQGPRGIEPEEIYLIVDGNDMEFHNYGKTYIGHRQKDGSQVIEWDEEPLLLEYSRLSFTSLVPCSKNDQPDGYELWFNLTYYGEDYSMLAGIDYKIRLR